MELINKIKEIEEKYKIVTLLFSARDIEHNNAMILLEVLR